MKRAFIIALLVCVSVSLQAKNENNTPANYVDTKIGSAGWGNCMVTPSTPFALAKPSPDCGTESAKGWIPMPAEVDGFSQTHLSGCGGGPKYGNVLIQPFTGSLDKLHHKFHRASEDIRFGYYSTIYEENNVKTELSADDKSSFYRFTYDSSFDRNLAIDLGFFLGPNTGLDENQKYVGSEIQVLSDTEVTGYTRIRGGWNKGRAYTIYFYLVSDTPFAQVRTWKNDAFSNQNFQADSGEATGANIKFKDGDTAVNVKIGISCTGCMKAKENLYNEIPHWSLEDVVETLKAKWDEYLSCIEISPNAPESDKRMFYTALYHSFMQPVNKTGECPLWNGNAAYYEDFYALWDTFRTTLPLYSLVYPHLYSDIVNSLLDTYKYDKYLPDARSGHCNGRTQGGSNADIVIAEAYAKSIPNIDWNLALEAVLKDADVPPGDDEEAEGRGGLLEYNSLGYVPFGFDRSCSRTVDYSVCDYAIYNFAKGMDRPELAERFLRQSSNWKNLWRQDASDDGSYGFILPKSSDGRWVEKFDYDKSKEDLAITPALTFFGELSYVGKWWGTCFYEGDSWIYSFGAYHDVPGMISLSGGAEAFEKKLDTFFDNGHYDVSNEPSFMTQNLYHWLGKPYRSSERVKEIIRKNYNDREDGIPGNDDTGAMSSWLIFNMIGLYPMAGQDWYLINSPIVESATVHLDGKDFTIRAEGLNNRNKYIISARLNGKDFPYSTIRHEDIVNGGELVLKMGPRPSDWGTSMFY